MSLTLIAPTAAPQRPDSHQTAARRLETHAFRYGRTYDSYLATDPGRELFWSRDTTSVVAFVRVGRYLQISGGLLADDRHKQQLLSELVEFAMKRNLVLSFYNIPDDQLPLFRGAGFQITKWGEEAVIDLLQRTWQGKAFEWVRRQSNYCRKQQVSFAECRRNCMPAAEWEQLMGELLQIAALSPNDKPQLEHIDFVQGSFDPHNLGRRRVFVARSEQGLVEGFLVANPCAEGRLWAFELYHHRPDAVRGTVAFLMHQTMQRLAEEGIEQVSLCLVPGLNCQQSRPGDSRLLRLALTVGTRYFNFIFDAAGLYHFKSRFRPRFESRYVCVYPKATIGSAWAFVRLVKVLKLDWAKSLRLAAGRLRKRASRSTLAVR